MLPVWYTREMKMMRRKRCNDRTEQGECRPVDNGWHDEDGYDTIQEVLKALTDRSTNSKNIPSANEGMFLFFDTFCRLVAILYLLCYNFAVKKYVTKWPHILGYNPKCSDYAVIRAR